MALTALSRFKRVSVQVDAENPNTIGIYYTVVGESQGIISFTSGYPETGTEERINLDILHGIYLSDDGLLDEDGNALTIVITGSDNGLVSTIADLEAMGYWNPLDFYSYERWINKHKVQGVFLRHGKVTEDATTGRKDIAITGGIEPKKAVPPSGDLLQSLEDWFVESSLTTIIFRINALPGSTFNTGTSLVSGTEVSDDPRVRAIFVWLESLRTVGNPLYGDTISTNLDSIHHWSISHFSMRTFVLDQDKGSAEDEITFTITSLTAGPSRLSFTITKSAGSFNIDGINEVLNAKTVEFPTTSPDEKPPFGNTDIPAKMERAVMPGGSLVIDRGIPSHWTATKRKPIGARDILTWDDLEVVAGETYRELPFGYFNFVLHVVSSVDRVVRIPSPWDIVPNIGGVVEFEIHNNNAYTDGSTVEVQESDGANIITLLGREVVPLELEWFKDGTGELRSPTRVPRTLEIAGDDLGNFNDVGYWELNSSEWVRPMLWPSTSERTQALRYNAEAFELGTDSITNAESLIGDQPSIHVEGAIKLLKQGRLRYDLQATISGHGSGFVGDHEARLILADSASHIGAFRPSLVPLPRLEVNDVHPWFLFYEDEGGHLDINDILCPMYAYPKSSTMNPSNVRVPSHRLAVTLFQDILVEYSP